MGYLYELAVAAAASVLLWSGAAKMVRPRPVTDTLSMLWGRIAGVVRVPRSAVLGLLLGFAEMSLAVFVVLVRSPAAAGALLLFGLALAAAGVVGRLGESEVPCNCFGAHGRPLGYVQIVQLPLWSAAAWSAAQPASAVGAGLDRRAAVLAACLAAVAVVAVARMWYAVLPLTRRRLRRVRSDGSGPVSQPLPRMVLEAD